MFTIDPITGMIRTKAVLDHEERNVYRVSVKATDAGRPPRHSIRALRVEVLALADNRPTFTSSSLTFNVSISPRSRRSLSPSSSIPPRQTIEKLSWRIIKGEMGSRCGRTRA